jgi:magnesium chelatase subunit D
VLYVDDINLLDDSVSNVLLSAISSGEVIVEREGLSVRYPCRTILVATFNPAGGELRAHLLDRIGSCISTDAEPLSLAQRVAATERVMRFADFPGRVEAEYGQRQQATRHALRRARELIDKITISPAQIGYLCEEATRARTQGQVC